MFKYSFIIPAYNRKNHLLNTLESLNQLIIDEKDNYEVIIVDDGSTDDTLNYIKKSDWNYSLKYIYLERTNESSRSRARNYGITAARGEILIFIDADIIVKNDYLKELKRCYSISDNMIVAGMRLLLPEDIPEQVIINGSYINKINKKFSRSEMEEFRHRIFKDLSYCSTSMNYPFLFAQTCNVAVPSKCIGQARFDENLIDWGIEDIEFAYQLYKNGVKIVFNSRIEVYHQCHADGEQGDFIILEKKIRGVENNTKKFIDKHGDIFNISSHETIELYKSLATKYKNIENIFNHEKNLINIEYRNNQNLEEILEQVKKLAEIENNEIHLYDYEENNDLDILIQHINSPFKNIRYYPVSKTKEISSSVISGKKINLN